MVGDGVVGSYVDGLVGRGVVRSAGVERAFRAVRRDLFVERFWVGRDSAHEVGADGWSAEALGLVYADEALITRRDAEGNPTSSASQPSVVAMMLEALDLRPGMRVLEIGAGTGYNAALMAEVVGDPRLVTTIDIDPDVVAQTRGLLARAGYGAVEVICGDGARGHAASAPFDRVVATVGCSDISWDWVEQIQPRRAATGSAGSRGFASAGEAAGWLDRSDGGADCGVDRVHADAGRNGDLGAMGCAASGCGRQGAGCGASAVSGAGACAGGLAGGRRCGGGVVADAERLVRLSLFCVSVRWARL